MGGGGKPQGKTTEYALKGSTGKRHKYKIKVWGKCTEVKIKTHGRVTVMPPGNCLFDKWSKDCENFAKKMRPIVQGMEKLESVHQVYMFIFMTGHQAGLDAGKKKEWNEAVGGWNNEFRKKVKRLTNQRTLLLRNRDSVCADFYNTKVLSLIQHALDPKTPPRLDGSRRHGSHACTSAFAEIPPVFFYSQIGRQMARNLAGMFNKDTYQKHKTDQFAKFLASDRKNASAGDLLDSTVFESTLQLMDHFLPAIASDPALAKNAGLNIRMGGFREFLQGKKMPTMATLDPRKMNIGSTIPSTTRITSYNVSGIKMEVKTISRADQLKSVALTNVLNTIGFLGAMDDLGKNKSFYAKAKGVKATAEIISSISKLSQLSKIQALSRGAGVMGLALEGGLSVWDAGKQLGLSTSRDDRTLLAGAHLLKAVGAGIMLCSLPIGAAIYLLGALGVIQLDTDPFIEWAKYTYFGASKFATGSKKKYYNSRLALFWLDRLIKAS
ncbi:hypothetical protein ACFL6S_21065 [Candidatus Poribacteria bacterium]